MNASLFGNHVAAEPLNDFKPFAVGAEANVIEQTEYEKAAFLKDGFREGIARSSEINKAIRQGSSIAAALTRLAAEKTGEDILDNGDIDSLSRQLETAISRVSSLLIGQASGSPDALLASFTPSLRELKNGLPVYVRALEQNTGTRPTFNADETGAKTIVKGNNLPLAAGDIAGAGHWLEMQYDEELDSWVLQNPAKGITPQSGVPVGTIEYFAMATPPAGYLKADGVAVGRETYPDLFAAVGTTFGQGDGITTFNLPDLIDRFAQGSNTPGQKIEAGVPDITGSFGGLGSSTAGQDPKGAFKRIKDLPYWWNNGAASGAGNWDFYASRSNSIYGASNTVQPPALTLLPCIKAFDAATNPGLIDVTELANDVTGKADKNLSNVNPVQSFKDTCVLWGMPDFSAPIDISGSFTQAGGSYTFQSTGIIVVTSVDNSYIYLSNHENGTVSSGTNIVASDSAAGVCYSSMTPVYENLKLYVVSTTADCKVVFYPLMGGI